MSEILNKIGNNLIKYRESKNITQEELAEICGLHRNYISSVENRHRNISIKTLEKIAFGLNIKIERLIE